VIYSALTAEILRVEELGAAEQQLWRTWQRADPALNSPFFAYEYVRAVGEVHPGARLAVLVRGGEIRAFLPFQHPGRLARALGFAEPVGGPMTDAVGAIAAPGFETTSRELLRATRLSSFLFTHLVAGQRRCGLQAEQIDPGLAIDLTAAADYWERLQLRRRGVVEELSRRRRRAAEELGPLIFTSNSPAPEQMLERLIELKVAQYRRTGTADALGPEWRRQLLRRLVRLRSPHCAGVLSTLEAGGRVIAAHFGLRSGPVLHYWFPVYDPEFSRFSPGRLLLAAIIDAAPAQGVSRIERGLGTAPVKRDFANAEVAYGRGLLLDHGLRGGAVKLGLAARWRMQGLARAHGALFGRAEAAAVREGESRVAAARSIPLGP
jgi:CelD/BcsL family acetyltransferase involved in cellulose biosynthesis